MAWMTPKLDWTQDDYYNYQDFNRVENNILEVVNYLNTIQYQMSDMRENTYSLAFDGVDDYVNLGSPASLNLIGDLTLEAWVNVSGYDSCIISWANGAYTTYPFHFIISSYGSVRMNVSTVYDSLTIIPLNTWTHVAATISGTTLKFYINGNLDSTHTISSTRAFGNGFLSISRTGTQLMKGNIDEVRIWNVARTQAQIKEKMCKHLIGNESGLVGYWDCNAGTGTTLTDRTANANNGTLNGATWSTGVPRVGIVKGRSASGFDFITSINRIEENIEQIKSNFMTPVGYGGTKVWTNGTGFSNLDAIRLEKNVQQLMELGVLVYESFEYCGNFICGQDRGTI